MAMAVGGAVAGVISGKRLHVALAAIGGGVLGTIALAIILIINGDWVGMGLIYGFPPGTIAGALAGALIEKKRSAG